jgi:DedD protein
MSVRYTAEAIMDAPALRDVDRQGGGAPGVLNVERWREKIEVRLDNRQVFFLFFGSALVACMLFVLGVMVGKRIESRGQADAPVMADPLAALDRARQPPPGVAAPDQPLTFQSSLVSASSGSKSKGTARASSPVGLPRPLAQHAAPPVPKPLAARSAAAEPKPPVARPTVTESKPAVPKAAVATAADPLKAKGKFTLHLSTFGTADEAQAFAQKYPGAFVVTAEVSGKGTAYRVRYGNYASFKDAAAAKDSFEKQHNAIALVAAR